MEFTIPELWQMFLAMCGSIATVAGAGVIIYKVYQTAKKPDAERDRMMKEHEKKLDNCTYRLDNVEVGMSVMMKANLAIMNQLIDGNHLDELKKASEDIQDYLISQKTDVLRNKEDKK